MPNSMGIRCAAFLFVLASVAPATAAPKGINPAEWKPVEKRAPQIQREEARVTLTSPEWGILLSPTSHSDVELAADVTIVEPARQFRFFASSWSVWPNRFVDDLGYEAALFLRAAPATPTTPESGYRVQFSHRYQDIALVKYPEGGYLRVVPAEIKLGKPQRLQVRAVGSEIVVLLDGQEKIRFVDRTLPLIRGSVGLAVTSGAKLSAEKVTVEDLPAPASPPQAGKHQPRLSARKWLGDRLWVFDGHEPILQLHTPEHTTLNNAKLQPGYKPMLCWNAQWDIANQGSFKAGENRLSEPAPSGGGETLKVGWNGQQVQDRFRTRTELTIYFDERRGSYVYATDSELTVQPGQPFEFRYGYDFEHHTPLDPFRWQYLVMKLADDRLVHRPVYPIDPGPQMDLKQYNGVRVWHGRHLETMQVAPAVEYDIHPSFLPQPEDATKPLPRKLNSAVCAAFYDTGVAFAPEAAKPGTKLRVKYRYTGYTPEESAGLFKSSTIYDSPTLDPNHHYIFAESWPKLTFDQFVPMSQTWIYGRNPFMSGHNQRPSYELAKTPGVGTGHAMKLGPASFGAAALPVPSDFQAGRYVVRANVKAINPHGPGGRIELTARQAKTNKELKSATHYLGNAAFDWKSVAFVFEVPTGTGGLTLGLGNAGTGEFLFSEIEFRRLADGEPLPAGTLPAPNSTPPKLENLEKDLLFDYRMEEAAGLHVFDYARGPMGLLELANLDWTHDGNRPALRFADNTTGKAAFPRAGSLDLSYFRHTAYEKRQTLPVAIAGMHGGGFEVKALTLAAWIKPAAAMGESTHSNGGDIVGVGARRFILNLQGQKAPYQLCAKLNVSDRLVAPVPIEADRWQHVALTCEPTPAKQWRVRLYHNGKQIHEGEAKSLPAPTSMPPSLILGAELFYLHDAYYRGLIGRTTGFNRALSSDEIAKLAAR